jgi:hypothetical protein
MASWTATGRGRRVRPHGRGRGARGRRAGKAARLERLTVTADDVLRDVVLGLRADANELVEHVLDSCRYCHGEGHKYQFTPAEFERELDAYLQADRLQKGGAKDPMGLKFIEKHGCNIGYDPRRPPHEDCPECFGRGVPQVLAKDTRFLSDEGRRQYAGAKVTKHGIEIQARDRDKALDLAAKHTGVSKETLHIDDVRQIPDDELARRTAQAEHRLLPPALPGAGGLAPRPGGEQVTPGPLLDPLPRTPRYLAYLALLEEQVRRLDRRKLWTYYPPAGPLRRELYPKHMAFFAAGAKHRERLMLAANRVGKTEGVGVYELVLHLTGFYPEWWDAVGGRRFNRPIMAWAAGDTGKTVRDILQTKLLGRGATSARACCRATRSSATRASKAWATRWKPSRCATCRAARPRWCSSPTTSAARRSRARKWTSSSWTRSRRSTFTPSACSGP